MHRRTSSKGSQDRGQLLSNVNSQLQQYKQRMQLLHQQLIVGQQKMKEVQAQQPPQPQVVAQYQRKLQQGIQQYRQLEVGGSTDLCVQVRLVLVRGTALNAVTNQCTPHPPPPRWP